ncbi:MAG: hypothetical protein O7G85_04290, partial [Planctomycetota bacterium]|nr:hypothetical protein [Planctomycetota bacterium]
MLNTWVNIDQPIFFIRNLTLSDGGRLFNTGNELVVSDTILIDGPLPGIGVNATMNVSITGSGSGITTRFLTVQNAGVLDLNGGILEVEESCSLDEDSLITGAGVLTMTWNSFLTMDSVVTGCIRPEAGGQITIDKTSSVSLDLDGAGAMDGSTYIDLTNPGAELFIQGSLADNFTGFVEIGNDSLLFFGRNDFDGQIDMVAAPGMEAKLSGWINHASIGQIDFMPGALLRVLTGDGRVNADTIFHLGATTFVATGASLRLLQGTYRFQVGSSFTVDGTLHFGGAEAHFSNPIIQGSGNIHLGSLTAYIDDSTTFNVSGFCNWTARTYSSLGQTLVINATKITDGDPKLDGFGNAADLGGDLEINTPDSWLLRGRISFVDLDPDSDLDFRLSGAPLVIAGSGVLDVENNVLRIDVPIQMEPDAILSPISAGTVFTEQPVTMLGGSIKGEYSFISETWLGTYLQNANLTVAGPSDIKVFDYRWNGNGPGPTYPQITIQSGGSLDIAAWSLVPRKGLTLVRGPLSVTDTADDAWELTGQLDLHSTSLSGSEMVVTDTGKLNIRLGVSTISTITAPLRIEEPASMEAKFGTTVQLISTTTLSSTLGGSRIWGAGTVRQFGDLVVDNVGASAFSRIDVDFYDWDGNEGGLTHVMANSRLAIDVEQIDLNNPLFDGYDGDIVLESGADLSVTTSNADWKMQGTMTMHGGCTITGDPMSVGGRLEGSGRFFFTDLNNAGVVAPGNSAPGSPFGEITVSFAAYEQFPGGTLEIEIGGTTPWSEHDLISG